MDGEVNGVEVVIIESVGIFFRVLNKLLVTGMAQGRINRGPQYNASTFYIPRNMGIIARNNQSVSLVPHKKCLI